MKISQATQGKWSSILSALGVDERYLTGRHSQCPSCGGKDRFRFDDKDGKGTFFCTHCGAGGGFKLLKNIFGWEFSIAAKKVEEVIGKCEAKEFKTSQTDPSVRLRAVAKRAKKINKGDPVYTYLQNRGIDGSVILDAEGIGYVKENYYKNGECVGNYDCMCGLIEDEKCALTYHLTYLSDGGKIKFNPSRKILPPKKPITGGAIRLFRYSDELGVAEGIETALSAYQLFKIPVWSVINENGMRGFNIPHNVKKIYVYADNDLNYVGQAAAYELARRASLKGLSVKIVAPEGTSNDWNDVLMTAVKRQGIQPG